MHQLDIRKINRADSLEVGLYSRTANVEIHADADRVTLSYRCENQVGEWQEYRCAVNLEWTPCNYGGKRPWWVCPDCGKRVARVTHIARGLVANFAIHYCQTRYQKPRSRSS